MTIVFPIESIMNQRLKLMSREARIPHLEIDSAECPAVLGRSMSCDLFVPCSLVSRRHGQLQFDGEVFLLSDLESTNGTIVNGESAISPAKLNNGDVVQLGNCVYQVQIDYLTSDSGLDDTQEHDSIVRQAQGGLAML